MYEHYGSHGAAMTANVITYRGKLAVRETGKVLGFDQVMIGKVAALAPMWGWKDPDHTAAVQFKEAGAWSCVRCARQRGPSGAGLDAEPSRRSVGQGRLR